MEKFIKEYRDEYDKWLKLKPKYSKEIIDLIKRRKELKIKDKLSIEEKNELDNLDIQYNLIPHVIDKFENVAIKTLNTFKEYYKDTESI